MKLSFSRLKIRVASVVNDAPVQSFPLAGIDISSYFPIESPPEPDLLEISAGDSSSVDNGACLVIDSVG